MKTFDIDALKKELLMSKLTHNFTFSRDEVMQLLGGHVKVLESLDKTPTEITVALDLEDPAIGGHILREMRLTRGWTQMQVSHAIEYSRTSITNMEVGRQVVTFDVLCLAAKALGFRLQIQAIASNNTN